MRNTSTGNCDPFLTMLTNTKLKQNGYYTIDTNTFYIMTSAVINWTNYVEIFLENVCLLSLLRLIPVHFSFHITAFLFAFLPYFSHYLALSLSRSWIVSAQRALCSIWMNKMHCSIRCMKIDRNSIPLGAWQKMHVNQMLQPNVRACTRFTSKFFFSFFFYTRNSNPNAITSNPKSFFVVIIVVVETICWPIKCMICVMILCKRC